MRPATGPSVAGDGEEFSFLGGRPVGPKGGGEKFTETIGRGAFPARGRQAHDAVFVGVVLQRIAAGYPFAGLIGKSYLRVECRGPAVTE